MRHFVVLVLGMFGGVQAACADSSTLFEVVEGANHQVEIYIAKQEPENFDLVLDHINKSELSVSVLISPDAINAENILMRTVGALNFTAEGDYPTLCILKKAHSKQDTIVVDHLSYRSDFQPENAKAFIGDFDGFMEEFTFPSSIEAADLMEGLNGTCRL
jgi:hypothetical protein